MSTPHIHQQSLRDSNGDLSITAVSEALIEVIDRTQYGGYMTLAVSFDSASIVNIPEASSDISTSEFDEYALTQRLLAGTIIETDITGVSGTANTKLTVSGVLTQESNSIIAIHEPLDSDNYPLLGPRHWDFWRMYKLTPFNGTPIYGVLDAPIPVISYTGTPAYDIETYFNKRGAITDNIAIDGDDVYELQLATLPVLPIADIVNFCFPIGTYFLAREISGSTATFKLYLVGITGACAQVDTISFQTSAAVESFLAGTTGQAIFEAIDEKYKATETFAVTYTLDINLKKATYKALKNNSCITDRMKRSKEFVLWQELTLIQDAIEVLADKEAWDDVVDCLNRAAELTANIE